LSQKTSAHIEKPANARDRAGGRGIDPSGGGTMPGLHDVVVSSPISAFKHAEATHAELEELRGIITLLRNVHVLAPLVLHEEYAITSRLLGATLLARYAGVDHANPGALVFHVVPRRRR
jgi:hypothetical protein